MHRLRTCRRPLFFFQLVDTCGNFAAAARDLGCLDALERNESCGGHFRVERQTKEGEALRDDDHYCHVAAWEYAGPNARPSLVKESLRFDYVKLSQRSYK
jgi:succinate dehydrogenase / fumarate reductase, flavoprotein subunit